MPNLIFTRDVKTETLDVKTTQNLVSLFIQGDLIKFTYNEVRSLPDGTVLLARTFSVDRTISTSPAPVLNWITQGATQAEIWRAQDEAARAAQAAAAALQAQAIAAEAARWAALTPAQQQAEIAAAAAAQPLRDPTPLGP